MHIDNEIKEFGKKTLLNWQRLTFTLRKHLDIWTHRHIKPIWGQMKLSYMPIIFNIDPEGSTAVDIARRSMIFKQTASRSIKELEEKGMIVGKENKKDKRSELLTLTAEGKKVVLACYQESFKLMETYINLVGEENFLIATDVLNKIIEYHESLAEIEDEHLGD